MSHSTLGMISATASGSDTRRHSGDTPSESTRVIDSLLSLRQKETALRDATLRMGRALKRVPLEVANRWYGFTRSECRYPKGHFLGSWPDIAESFAKAGAPLNDVMSPVSEVELRLKREVYRKEIPPLEVVEQMEAQIVCRVTQAELSHDIPTLVQAAREEVRVAELLEEAADRAAHTTGAR